MPSSDTQFDEYGNPVFDYQDVLPVNDSINAPETEGYDFDVMGGVQKAGELFPKVKQAWDTVMDAWGGYETRKAQNQQAGTIATADASGATAKKWLLWGAVAAVAVVGVVLVVRAAKKG